MTREHTKRAAMLQGEKFLRDLTIELDADKLYMLLTDAQAMLEVYITGKDNHFTKPQAESVERELQIMREGMVEMAMDFINDGGEEADDDGL